MYRSYTSTLVAGCAGGELRPVPFEQNPARRPCVSDFGTHHAAPFPLVARRRASVSGRNPYVCIVEVLLSAR